MFPESNKSLQAYLLFGFSQLLFSEINLSLVKKRNMGFRGFKYLVLAHMERQEQKSQLKDHVYFASYLHHVLSPCPPTSLWLPQTTVKMVCLSSSITVLFAVMHIGLTSVPACGLPPVPSLEKVGNTECRCYIGPVLG